MYAISVDRRAKCLKVLTDGSTTKSNERKKADLIVDFRERFQNVYKNTIFQMSITYKTEVQAKRCHTWNQIRSREN